MRLLLFFILIQISFAGKALLELKNGKENLVYFHEMKSDTLFVAPLSKKNMYVPIPIDSVALLEEDEICIDLAKGFFDPEEPRWNLKEELIDTLRFPKVEAYLHSGESNKVRFYKWQDGNFFFTGLLPNGKLRIFPINEDKIKYLKLPNGKYFLPNSQSISFPADSNKLTTAVSYIQISTRPSDAQIFVNGLDWGEAPIQKRKITPGDYVIEARFRSATDSLYARRKVKLTDWDTLNLNMRLVKETPLLLLRTQPAGVEVYFGEKPNLSIPSPKTTPNKFKLASGPNLLTLFHPDFQDSSLVVEIDPLKPTLIDVELKGLNDRTRVLKKDLLHKRNKGTIFKFLQAGSIPLMFGGLSWFLQADQNEELAQRYKNKLLSPAVNRGENYLFYQNKNIESYNRSKRQNEVGWGLFFSGILLQGIAWTFYF